MDVETTGLSPEHHEVVQLGGIAYNGETMEPIPAEEGGTFESLLRPLTPATVQQEALKANGLRMEDLLKAPHPKAVWLEFVAWVQNWNPKKGVLSAPILAGKNIRNFDMKFLAVLNERYSPKKEKEVLFNRREQIDLEDLLRHWFWFDASMEKMSMDYIRNKFGMSTAGAHSALVDCRQTGFLISYFMKLTRELRNMQTTRGLPLLDFETAFQGR